ncbi:hypothetical protein BS78_02G031900 [Paspalum vaginatum]|nr:hypothetical protein BS78_02G031900 [Paspalum vaginatum]
MPGFPQLPDPPPPPVPPPPASSTAAAPAATNALPNLLVPVAAVKPTMIIRSVLGRYERWNPVHPTAGAFWGVGLGLGCGVGWGPGFGPEVIGYVGAGCGVGFSVGFTLAGVGIGLPQHGGFAINVPLDPARFYAVPIIRGLVWDAISYATNAAAVRKESRQKLLRLQGDSQVSGVVDLPKLGKGVSGGVDLPKLGKGASGGFDLPKLGKGVSSSIRSTVECIKAFKDQHWPP